MFFYLRTRQRHMEREKGPLLPWEPLLVLRGWEMPLFGSVILFVEDKMVLSIFVLSLVQYKNTCSPFISLSPSIYTPQHHSNPLWKKAPFPPNTHSLIDLTQLVKQPNIILPPKHTHTHTHTLNLSLYIVPLHPSYLSSQLPIYLSSYVFLGTKYHHYYSH